MPKTYADKNKTIEVEYRSKGKDIALPSKKGKVDVRGSIEALRNVGKTLAEQTEQFKRRQR